MGCVWVSEGVACRCCCVSNMLEFLVLKVRRLTHMRALDDCLRNSISCPTSN